MAVTVVLALRTTVQLPVPEHAPDQPLNVALAAGTAVKTTVVPAVNEPTQVLPQLTPAGLLVTVPFPVPLSLTVSWSCEGALWPTP